MYALDNLVEAIAEIVYDNISAEQEADNDWKSWEELIPDEQEVYTRTAEEIIEIIQDQLEILEG